MKVIGLTGGIGSGKSTVADFLAELGAVIIDADEVGHEAFPPESEGGRRAVAAFGQEILAPDGSINRRKLGDMVFGNPKALSRLNRIMHPLMYDMVKAKIEEYRRKGVAVVVLEAPLLIEAGWTSLVDGVWVVVASEAAVLTWLEERTGLSREESLARIRSQLSSEERIKHADVVIDNDGDLDELKAKIKELWQGL